jgi:hypothetical protein
MSQKSGKRAAFSGGAGGPEKSADEKNFWFGEKSADEKNLCLFRTIRILKSWPVCEKPVS